MLFGRRVVCAVVVIFFSSCFRAFFILVCFSFFFIFLFVQSSVPKQSTSFEYVRFFGVAVVIIIVVSVALIARTHNFSVDVVYALCMVYCCHTIRSLDVDYSTHDVFGACDASLSRC